jgi:hypothetical protein
MSSLWASVNIFEWVAEREKYDEAISKLTIKKPELESIDKWIYHDARREMEDYERKISSIDETYRE